MDVVPAVAVPLRGGKKMKKRKELDALVAHTVNKRTGGVSSHEQLLTESTDEWTPGPGSASRARRRVATRRRACSTLARACSVLLIFTCAIATTTVMWLFIDVRQQVTFLRTELNQVVAAHQGVPDALQACHSLSRDLQKNQTAIMERLTGFSFMLGNFSVNLTDVRTGLVAVEQQLKNSPSLVNDPRLVKDLSESVAKFGSKIQDLETTAIGLKEQDKRLDSQVSSLSVNLTELRGLVSGLSINQDGVTAEELSNQKSFLTALIGQISSNVSNINDTLTNQLLWATKDRSNDHNDIENLKEMNQNVTARLATLEGQWTRTTTTTTAATVSAATVPAPVKQVVTSLPGPSTDLQKSYRDIEIPDKRKDPPRP